MSKKLLHPSKYLYLEWFPFVSSRNSMVVRKTFSGHPFLSCYFIKQIHQLIVQVHLFPVYLPVHLHQPFGPYGVSHPL